MADVEPVEVIAVKETLAMYLDRYGDIRVTNVTEITPKQMTIEEMSGGSGD